MYSLNIQNPSLPLQFFIAVSYVISYLLESVNAFLLNSFIYTEPMLFLSVALLCA